MLALRSEERGLDGLVDRAVLVMLAVHDDERSRSNEAGIPLVAEVVCGLSTDSQTEPPQGRGNEHERLSWAETRTERASE